METFSYAFCGELLQMKLSSLFIRIALSACLAAVVLFSPLAALAADTKARSSDTLIFYLENDFFDDLDGNYTHGMKISWVSQDLSKTTEEKKNLAWMRYLADRIPVFADAGIIKSFSVSLGQNMYTPRNKKSPYLIRDDRPYAGVTYLDIGFHGRNESSMDSLELQLGIVGRHSYAQDLQEAFHDWTHSTVPKGWEHQLHDEPIVNLYAERKWKLLKLQDQSGLGIDFIPHAGLAVGNAYTGINLGGQVRFGWNIPNDFGTHLIRPGSDASVPADDADPRFFEPWRRIGFHGFAAVDGRAIARNLLLDGNTFRDSHSVDKEPFVADVMGGAALIIHRFKITYTYVYRTREFKTQKGEQHFGSISIAYTF